MFARKFHQIAADLIELPRRCKEDFILRQVSPQQQQVEIGPPAAEPVQQRVAKQIRVHGKAAGAGAGAIAQHALRRQDLRRIPPFNPIGHGETWIVGVELDAVAVSGKAAQAEELIGVERLAMPETANDFVARLWRRGAPPGSPFLRERLQPDPRPVILYRRALAADVDAAIVVLLPALR